MCISAVINVALLKGGSVGYAWILQESPSPASQMTCLYSSSTSKCLIETKRFHLIRQNDLFMCRLCIYEF